MWMASSLPTNRKFIERGKLSFLVGESMEILGRILTGSFIGAFLNSIAWYFWTVLFVLISTSKLDWGGEWGGNFAAAIIGGIIGGFTGGIVGITQPTKTNAVIFSGVVALICFALVMIPFLSNEYAQFYLQEGNYQLILLEIIGFAGYFIICVLVVWIVAKIVLSFRKKNKFETISLKKGRF